MLGRIYFFWLSTVIFSAWAQHDLSKTIRRDLEEDGYIYDEDNEVKSNFKDLSTQEKIQHILTCYVPIVNIFLTFKLGYHYVNNKEKYYEVLKDLDLISEIDENEEVYAECFLDENGVQQIVVKTRKMNVSIMEGEEAEIISEKPLFISNDKKLIIEEPKMESNEEKLNITSEDQLNITIPKTLKCDIKVNTKKGDIFIDGINLAGLDLKTNYGKIKVCNSIPEKTVISKRNIANDKCKYKVIDEKNMKVASLKIQNLEEISNDEFLNIETTLGKSAFQYKKKIK